MGRVIPFRRPAREPEEGSGFVEIARARDQAEALVLQSLLEAHGVRVVLRTHLAQSVHPFAVGDQGVVHLLVPRAAAAESRRLLAGRAEGSASS